MPSENKERAYGKEPSCQNNDRLDKGIEKHFQAQLCYSVKEKGDLRGKMLRNIWVVFLTVSVSRYIRNAEQLHTHANLWSRANVAVCDLSDGYDPVSTP